MPDGNPEPLDRVAEMVDQLIDQVIGLLVLKTRNPDQLVLSVTREQALRGLQQVLHDEITSVKSDGNKFWRLTSAIVATAIAYTADTMSDSIPYEQRREQSGDSSVYDARLLAANRIQEIDCLMRMGKTIKFLRLAAELKQSDLAERLGVSSNYISLVENDKRDPSMSFLRDLSDELRVPLGLLFLEVESDQDKTSPEERALLVRIKDLVFQIERMRLQRESQTTYGT